VISPHRIVTYARDMVSSLSEREFASAEEASFEFAKMCRERGPSGFYAKLFLNGSAEPALTASMPAVNE
jgi:hypothetical protein